jgi:ferredoxin-NADP reductase/mono/diheme cytochrome c family protein
MLTSQASIVLGLAFMIIGAINVWLVLQSSARLKSRTTNARLLAAHRIGGYLFITLFCVMAYFMMFRLGDAAADPSPGTMLHLALAMVLTPLLFVKVLIARYYKTYYGILMPIGLIIFVLSFVLIAIAAGPYLIRTPRMERVSPETANLPPVTIDLNLAAATMQKRCSKCHNLDRVFAARKDAHGWRATVERMRAQPSSGISETDVGTIVGYLSSQVTRKGPGPDVDLEVGRALVDQRCSRCHNLDRIYRDGRSPQEWRSVVTRMVSYAAGSAGEFQPGEDQQIIAYLSTTQTPEAVNKRKAGAEAASSTGRSLIAQTSGASARAPAPRKYDFKAFAFISLVCLSTLSLVVRRPGKRPVDSTSPETAPVSAPGGRPLILRLVRITQQTPDARTLRFVPGESCKLLARPGQFLTFSFLFDGKKVIRSYSICSSPARSGYIEITPKRVPQGCASVFLNDRASLGMTVEANGPFGQFCFDETQQQKIVLIAAGSGITPMMAILGYIDDLCVETSVVLLYCVRTRDDIMFHRELERFRTAIKNFQYHLLLSQPDVDWPGPRGRISREFVGNTINDLDSQEFFLCGPASFMEVSQDVLISLGVKPARIRQESFGAARRTVEQAPQALESGVLVEFVRSGKKCSVRQGQTLLQAAEEHGVAIPSSCRQGQCGTCKRKLLEGSVRMDAEEGLDADSKAKGFVLTCVGHADGVVKLDA